MESKGAREARAGPTTRWNCTAREDPVRDNAKPDSEPLVCACGYSNIQTAREKHGPFKALFPPYEEGPCSRLFWMKGLLSLRHLVV